MSEKNTENKEISNFIYTLVKEDLGNGGRFENKKIHTRFPPEPNGYLHIGHAKAICVNFMMAQRFNGKCNLRMDDTNPSKEDTEYVESIKQDIKWLGFDWGDKIFYASDYFEQMFEYACELIEKGLAYVCELSPKEVKNNRGDLKNPAKSIYRDRPKEESMQLFLKMKNGEVPDGKMTLRAKIDLLSGNFNMRDPVIYRVSHKEHHNTGNKWCIYPMYDFAHPLEDAIEGITHSLCTLEFEEHRPLYNWFRDNVSLKSKPRQIEFARLNMSYTVMSKRKLRMLVENNFVSGWDDPRMPTISGLRRRGYTPDSIRNFCEKIGLSKVNSTVDYGFLEHCLREDLNVKAKRVMVVLDPIKLIINNYEDTKTEVFELENNPNKPEDGKHKISFSKELYIERTDFAEDPPRKYFRLYEGNEVRLKGSYIVKCTGYKKDEKGNITEVYADYDKDSRGGNASDGRKIKGTIHWVDAKHSMDTEVRLYDKLFTVENPDSGEKDFTEFINKDSLKVLTNAKIDKNFSAIMPLESYQFMRHGYFCLDEKDSTQNKPVFNKTVSLKDGYKQNKK